jgi:hypothetical protein
MRTTSFTLSFLIAFFTLVFLPSPTIANTSAEHQFDVSQKGHNNFACSKQQYCRAWFLAPQNYASGRSIQGIDPATGILRQSQTDLVPLNSGLGLRRFYQSSSQGDGWQHQYLRQLSGNQNINYQEYDGLKTDLYHQAKKAYYQGWSEIRDTAYNGNMLVLKLTTGKAYAALKKVIKPWFDSLFIE